MNNALALTLLILISFCVFSCGSPKADANKICDCFKSGNQDCQSKLEELRGKYTSRNLTIFDQTLDNCYEEGDAPVSTIPSDVEDTNLAPESPIPTDLEDTYLPITEAQAILKVKESVMKQLPFPESASFPPTKAWTINKNEDNTYSFTATVTFLDSYRNSKTANWSATIGHLDEGELGTTWHLVDFNIE